MELEIPYYAEYTNLVASFMEEMGRTHGATKEERRHLRLIGEEAYVFIVKGIPKVGIKDSFHLHCNEDGNGLIFYFTNHGRPLNVRKIPEFDSHNVDETSDILSLNIVKCFSHEFGYKNRGKDGWELMIRFHINDYKSLSVFNYNESDYDEEVQEEFTVRRATETDVPGIINLVYNTYRYSYAKEVFYNEVKLAEMIRENKIVSVIAVTESGKIIGHNAILLDSPLLGEAGMSMVDPNYRKSKAFLSMVIFTTREFRKEYPNLLTYAKCVTSHPRSQAFVANFTTSLLQLSVYNHAAFVGIHGDVNPRESLAYSIYNFSNDSSEQDVYVPQEHLEIISGLFTKAKFKFNVLPYISGHEEIEKSVFKRETLPGRQYAEITVEVEGKDFSEVLSKETSCLCHNGVMTIGLLLPTGISMSEGINAELLKAGYFFCGVKPAADGSWKVVYCNLLSQNFDFDKLQLFAEDTKILCEYIKQEYAKTQFL